MKLLFLEWDSFCNQDMQDAFRDLGHEVVCFFLPKERGRENPVFEGKLRQKIQAESPDFVFSFNYFPVVSHACNKEELPYLSWVYDSPYILLYHYTTIYSCNHIFIFDKSLYLEFRNAGIQTVHYLPMAANTKRLDALFATEQAGIQEEFHHALEQMDISFVGSLYNQSDKLPLFGKLQGLHPYTAGYLAGLMQAQSQVYGCNFIQDCLNREVLKHLLEAYYMETNADGAESIEYLYAQYVINKQITAEERNRLLQAIAADHVLDLYTTDETYVYPNIRNHGAVHFYTLAPFVFRNTKINLNISLRSITSGMPLRAFDIMGSGGFLLSNFQMDFLDYFIPGEDFAFFESERDLLDKIGYYLQNEQERKDIAQNGYRKVKAAHTFEHRVKEMLAVSGVCS